MSRRALTVILIVAASWTSAARGEALGTAFTYQGELELNGQLVDSACDFEFVLWAHETSTDPVQQIGPVLTFDGQGGNPGPITPDNGRFTVELDFGEGAITGEARWLEIKVCCPSPCGGSYSTLTPRQKLTPAPHALALPAVRIEQRAESPNVVAGFKDNSVDPLAKGVTIGGGGRPSLPNRIYDDWATIAGGVDNVAGSDNGNPTTGYETISGGYGNLARCDGACVGGGHGNTAYSAFSTIAGGQGNQAGVDGQYSPQWATVGGGHENQATGENSTVVGGYDNVAAGWAATVAGGRHNVAQGACSFAAGRAANATYYGCFVWGDHGPPYTEITCSGPNQWRARSRGGVYFYTSEDLSTGSYLAPGSGSWTSVSDRAAKENLDLVDKQEVLRKLVAIPVTTWNYKAEGPSIRHMGPMAQDLHAAFGLGDSDKSITSIDADGVTLAAIQGLHEILQKKDEEIASLQTRVAALEKAMAAIVAQSER